MADSIEESKDKASKWDVQTTDLNKMPAPELDDESAAEMVYGSRTDLAKRSAFSNKENNRNNQQS